MKHWGMLTIAAVLLLTGCAAATVDATPTPTTAPNTAPNTGPCEAFADLAVTIRDVVNDDAMDEYEALVEQFDAIALDAEGVTQQRMLEFIDDWPDAFDVMIWKETEGLNASLRSVERACVADGVAVSFPQFTTAE